MNSVNVTSARKNLYKLVQQVVAFNEPVQINGKDGAAVMISLEDWRAIEETIFLNQIPGMAQSIKKGLAMPIENCSEELTW